MVGVPLVLIPGQGAPGGDDDVENLSGFVRVIPQPTNETT